MVRALSYTFLVISPKCLIESWTQKYPATVLVSYMFLSFLGFYDISQCLLFTYFLKMCEALLCLQ